MSGHDQPGPIERAWQSYRMLVVPASASNVQIHETRQAFFAGAAILLRSITQSLDPGDEPTEADMRRMERIQAELDEFGLQLDLRYLTGGHG